MLSAIVTTLIPPASLAWAALAALLLRLRRVAVGLLVVLVLLSLPGVSEALLAALYPGTPVAAGGTEPGAPPGAPPGAIVILSADVDRLREGNDVGGLTLERERAGAALARRTGLPVLVTGGLVVGPTPVAELMVRSMEADFGVRPRWVEPRSPTTWENAAYSAPLLRADGIGRVYLVTHAWHMRRALIAFRRAGVDAVPVPVRLDPWPQARLSSLVPKASSWERSFLALHEWVGLLYYSWRP